MDEDESPAEVPAAAFFSALEWHYGNRPVYDLIYQLELEDAELQDEQPDPNVKYWTCTFKIIVPIPDGGEHAAPTPWKAPPAVSGPKGCTSTST